MRNISFSMTEDQVGKQTKTVTRRLGWKNLKPGDLLRGVHKCMGLKRGESPRVLAFLEVTSVRREPLYHISQVDVGREGYPGMSQGAFIQKFCVAMKCTMDTTVTRIEFKYV